MSKGEKMLSASGRAADRKRSLGRQPTTFVSDLKHQKVPGKALKSMDYILGSSEGRGTAKPSKYRA